MDYLVENKQTMLILYLFRLMYAFSYKLKSERMQEFTDPNFIAWKTVWEAKGIHTVETTKEASFGGNINAAIDILQKQNKMIKVMSMDWLQMFCMNWHNI